ncbi:heavy metal-binding domain-containing protein [Caulobacter sp. S45]|uniref:heavy metal-binding domain-containing protein n=1 Tax=Caulobacter sp. S45 TaxID=1641861 RepID=UPI0015775E5C|nr:heavy metal-binding domain-containing protein [Caulobacter sp. S45]
MPTEAQAAARGAAWESALAGGQLPEFVVERLQAAAQGRLPWLSTMTPAELRLARSHGIKPIATVSGTCWYQYGRSWTEGHAAGWRAALQRLRAEAIVCGANAVVDVKMRTVHTDLGASMDYTLLGTAVRMEGLPASPDPVVATVPALEFVRLLEMGIVPVGIAVGARYQWLTGYLGYNDLSTRPLPTLGEFWESVRRHAHAELRADAARQGTGVLAHTQFSQLLRQEVDKQPPNYLGRHIVIGTVVETRRGDGVPHHLQTVVDMRDDVSPLLNKARGPAANNLHDKEGGI